MCKHVVLVPVKTVDSGKLNLIKYSIKITVIQLIVCTHFKCNEDFSFRVHLVSGNKTV